MHKPATGSAIQLALNSGIILVVDDFATMRKLIMNQLKKMGARNVVEAENGIEGLKVLGQGNVRMIVTDWNMPLMSGLELLRAARQQAEYRDIPIIMVTAEAERQNVEAAIASGISDIIVKPFTPQQLKARITRAITSRTNRIQIFPAQLDDEVLDLSLHGDFPQPMERQRILAVDDSPDNLIIIGELCEPEYAVTAVKSAREALQLCNNGFTPDLILLDVMMPEMDGITLLERLRKIPILELTPAILISADTTEATKLRGLTCGAVDYIDKPISPALLNLRVRNFMRYIQLQRSLQANCDTLLENARLKEQVEQIARHDIKGLLAVLPQLSQTLLEAPELHHELRDHLFQIEEIATRALDLINCSAEIYKIETNQFALNPTSFPIAREIRKALRLTESLYSNKKIRAFANLPTSEEVLCLAEPNLTYSAFQNLLKNAFEAAPAGSEVSIELESNTAGDQVLIRLRNSGTVPTAIRERFFEKFSTSGKPGGSGLGTYSARLLVEAQLGSVTMITSDESNQTTIEVTLPRAKQ